MLHKWDLSFIEGKTGYCNFPEDGGFFGMEQTSFINLFSKTLGDYVMHDKFDA